MKKLLSLKPNCSGRLRGPNIVMCNLILDRWDIKLHSRPTMKDLGGGLPALMKELKIPKGFVLYPGKEDYSMGNGIIALSTERILSDPKYPIS